MRLGGRMRWVVRIQDFSLSLTMKKVWHIQRTDIYEYSDIVVVYICVLDHSSYLVLLCIAHCLIVVISSNLSLLLRLL